MKIGIFTLHSNTNFGGGLQQIALFEVLKAMGHEPRFLCVKNNSHLSTSKRIAGILTSYSVPQLADTFKEAIERIYKKKAAGTPNLSLYERTDNFNYSVLNYTPKFPVSELPDYVSDCDALIFGSDQIWTDVYSNVLPYFGDGIPDYKGKKIAYAACSAHDKAPFFNRAKIRALLADFDSISVRDLTTKRLVERYSTQKPTIVCDPTMLYDFEKYIKPYGIGKPYIFAYVLGDKSSEWHRRNIEKIKQSIGDFPVVALTTELDEQFTWADITISDALSVDWLNILRESAFVYTNSFHAVVFSMKFHREFVAYYGDLVRSSRMVALRKQFGLEERIVKHPSSVDYSKKIDFERTDKLIDEIAKKSKDFLNKALMR